VNWDLPRRSGIPSSDGGAETEDRSHLSSTSYDRRNLLSELEEVDARIEYVRATDPSGFRDFTVAYDVASMAVIRVRAILEVEEFAYVAAAVDEADVKGLTAVRNFVAHGGYVHANADMLWSAVTEYLPRVVEALRRAVARSDGE